MSEVILKRFETPDGVISFEKGRFGGVTIGRAVYEPGRKWSTLVGSKTGATLCQVEHVGLVVSGRATAALQDGTVIEMRAADLFYIPPGHDSWVVGDEPTFPSISPALKNTRTDSVKNKIMSSEEYYASEFSDEYLPAHGHREAHLLVSVSDFYTS